MTQISISIPVETLKKVDQCAAVDRRARSNWIVTELERRIAQLEAKQALEKGGKSQRRTGPFPSTAEAHTPRGGINLNEESARPSAVPAPSTPPKKIGRTRAVLREIARKHKSDSKQPSS